MVKGEIGRIHLDMALDKILSSPIWITLENIWLVLKIKDPEDFNWFSRE